MGDWPHCIFHGDHIAPHKKGTRRLYIGVKGQGRCKSKEVECSPLTPTYDGVIKEAPMHGSIIYMGGQLICLICRQRLPPGLHPSEPVVL